MEKDNITNDIRRLKIKLKLFEQEGFSWVIGDLMQDMYPIETTTEEIEYVVANMKSRYNRQLKELLPEELKQQKLEL